MFTPLQVAGAFLATAAIISVTSLTLSTTAFAQEAPAPSSDALTTVPLEITPVCADANAMKAVWKVVNKNDVAVTVEWSNADSDTKGTYVAPASDGSKVNSVSRLDTDYRDGSNNQTFFTYSNGVAQTSTNSSNTPCDPTYFPVEPPVDCIDGNVAGSLAVTWEGNNIAHVSTVNGKQLCEDVTIFLSSYALPANYDGLPFNYNAETQTFDNTTAFPQHIFDSTSVTLVKGTNGTYTFTVTIPAACIGTQIDVYYGPEVTLVGLQGHGTQHIASQVFIPVGTCDNGGETPVEPPVVTPVTPTTPVIPTTPPATPPLGMGSIGGNNDTTPVAVELPAMLPQTGGIAPNTMLYALALAFVTYLGLYLVLPRRSNQ